MQSTDSPTDLPGGAAHNAQLLVSCDGGRPDGG
jgi:hypothetical protein